MVFGHEIRNIVLFAIVSLPIIIKDLFNYKMRPALQLDNRLASMVILYMPDFCFHFWYILAFELKMIVSQGMYHV